MEMVYIPAGEFIMGTEKGKGDNSEYPQHTIYLDAYWMDKTEVTNAMYQKCVDAGICLPSTYADPSRSHPEYTKPDLPIMEISWFDARSYCKWVGRRLPTEAEWEKSARGTDGRIYPWGNSYDCSIANTDELCDPYKDNAPVGSFPEGASPYGVLDLAGNVSEWVADWYKFDYYVHSPYRNPLGPETGQNKVIRGGGSFGPLIRSARREQVRPTYRHFAMGFRCAISSND